MLGESNLFRKSSKATSTVSNSVASKTIKSSSKNNSRTPQQKKNILKKNPPSKYKALTPKDLKQSVEELEIVRNSLYVLGLITREEFSTLTSTAALLQAARVKILMEMEKTQIEMFPEI